MAIGRTNPNFLNVFKGPYGLCFEFIDDNGGGPGCAAPKSGTGRRVRPPSPSPHPDLPLKPPRWDSIGAGSRQAFAHRWNAF
jgi:hypothetical protein